MPTSSSRLYVKIRKPCRQVFWPSTSDREQTGRRNLRHVRTWPIASRPRSANRDTAAVPSIKWGPLSTAAIPLPSPAPDYARRRHIARATKARILSARTVVRVIAGAFTAPSTANKNHT